MLYHFISALAVETDSISAWNTLPDRNRVQSERFNPLTWARKKYTLQTE